MSSENSTAVKCLIIEDGYDLIAIPITEHVAGILPELLEIRKVAKNSEGNFKFAVKGQLKFYIVEASEVENGKD